MTEGMGLKVPVRQLRSGPGVLATRGWGCWKACLRRATASWLLGVVLPLGRRGEWSWLRGWAVRRAAMAQMAMAAAASWSRKTVGRWAMLWAWRRWAIQMAMRAESGA